MLIELKEKHLGCDPGTVLNVKRRQGEALVARGTAKTAIKRIPKKKVPKEYANSKALKGPPADRMVKSADVVTK